MFTPKGGANIISSSKLSPFQCGGILFGGGVLYLERGGYVPRIYRYAVLSCCLLPPPPHEVHPRGVRQRRAHRWRHRFVPTPKLWKHGDRMCSFCRGRVRMRSFLQFPPTNFPIKSINFLINPVANFLFHNTLPPPRSKYCSQFPSASKQGMAQGHG